MARLKSFGYVQARLISAGFTMRLFLTPFFFASLLLSPAHAITITQKGDGAYLSGLIKPGAYVILREFLAKPRTQRLRVIYLSSPGGKVEDATLMTRDIRNTGLITAVNGDWKCMSACTMLFAAGVKRHYFNHGKIRDELLDDYKKRTGLGYHQAHSKGISGNGRDFSGRGTQNLINVYYEQGSPAAADFATKAGQNQMYLVSGATALANGLATSLSSP